MIIGHGVYIALFEVSNTAIDFLKHFKLNINNTYSTYDTIKY